MLGPICAKLAETDPLAAFDLVTNKAVRTNVTSMMNDYWEAYKACTPEQLVELSDRAIQLSPDIQYEALVRLPLAWAGKMKPADTLAWAQAHLTKPDELRQFIFTSGVLTSLVSKDAKAAQAWVAGFPDGAMHDAAQQVFTNLARKAGSLGGRATVAGWLHTSARYAASAVVRGERRRRAREQEASICLLYTSRCV